MQSDSQENSGSKLLNTTSSAFSGRIRSAQAPNQNQFAFDSERSKNSSSLLKPGKPNPPHSVENTPASRVKDSSVMSGTNDNQKDNASRRERSLSAFTDESYEPCGFMDYYQAYKKENNIPPSEMGERDTEISAHLRPPAFGVGILRRNTVEVNHSGIMATIKNKEIQEIEEAQEEVFAK